ncbi:MAG TPA: FCD domain-containing protein, partial [Pararobbsia sp.]|nr:FCD domain-containing protein [Pararobbsia sp.]
RESDPDTMFGMDEDFHRRLVAATGNNEMLRVHNEVTERIRIVRRLDFVKPHRTSATYDEHAKMLYLLERSRIQEANILLRAHITQSKLEVRRITLSMLAAARDQKLPFVS